jgi:hypothetical protein
MCPVDRGTTNSILFRNTKYFQTLTIMFFNGTQVMIDNALLYPDSTGTLISFRDIRKIGLQVCTHEDNKEEFLLITKSSRYVHEVLERITSTHIWIVLYIH